MRPTVKLCWRRWTPLGFLTGSQRTLAGHLDTLRPQLLLALPRDIFSTEPLVSFFHLVHVAIQCDAGYFCLHINNSTKYLRVRDIFENGKDFCNSWKEKKHSPAGAAKATGTGELRTSRSPPSFCYRSERLSKNMDCGVAWMRRLFKIWCQMSLFCFEKLTLLTSTTVSHWDKKGRSDTILMPVPSNTYQKKPCQGPAKYLEGHPIASPKAWHF